MGIGMKESFILTLIVDDEVHVGEASWHKDKQVSVLHNGSVAPVINRSTEALPYTRGRGNGIDASSWYYAMEEKFMELWKKYSCMHDVSSRDDNDKVKR